VFDLPKISEKLIEDLCRGVLPRTPHEGDFDGYDKGLCSLRGLVAH
jgi:hypothetical protein